MWSEGATLLQNHHKILWRFVFYGGIWVFHQLKKTGCYYYILEKGKSNLIPLTPLLLIIGRTLIEFQRKMAQRNTKDIHSNPNRIFKRQTTKLRKSVSMIDKVNLSLVVAILKTLGTLLIKQLQKNLFILGKLKGVPADRRYKNSYLQFQKLRETPVDDSVMPNIIFGKAFQSSNVENTKFT